MTKEINIQLALNTFPMPIVVLSVGEGRKKAGMTACWISQISWKPPLLGIAVYHKWTTLQRILEYKEFAVHLVSEDLVSPAFLLFGSKSSAKVDKFEEAAEKYGLRIGKGKKVRAPIILDAPIVIECRLKEYFIVGDHYFIVCKPILAYRNNNKKPVVCMDNKPYSIGELVKIFQNN